MVRNFGVVVRVWSAVFGLDEEFARDAKCAEGVDMGRLTGIAMCRRVVVRVVSSSASRELAAIGDVEFVEFSRSASSLGACLASVPQASKAHVPKKRRSMPCDWIGWLGISLNNNLHEERLPSNIVSYGEM